MKTKEQIVQEFFDAKKFCDENNLQLSKKFVRFVFPDAELQFKTAFDLLVKGYTHHSEYDKIIEYLKDNKGKSLLITGSCGTGKSAIACSIIPLMFATIRKIVRPMTAQQFAKLKQFPNNEYLIIDDLGLEGEVKNYGTEIDNLSDLMDKLERVGGCTVVMTSNLTGEQMKEKYGERFMDRLINNFVIVRIEGKSNRKYNG